MTKHIAYLSLGSNIGDRQATLNRAIHFLNQQAGTITDVADFYVTSPVGGVVQEAFLNTAVRLETTLTPTALLATIHQIEQAFHRERRIHWGPRTLDIDMIFFDTVTMATETLTLPHPEAFNRLFVLIPVAQIYHETAYQQALTEQISRVQATTDQEIRKVSHD